MSDRKQQILREAIEIIATEGYGNFTMRALARAGSMKLGALQYYFRTWEELLRGLAAYISDEYRQSFEALKSDDESPSLLELVRFIMDDAPATKLRSDRLFPQLWAMGQVEPVMEELLGDIYVVYLGILQELLAAQGSRSPRPEALALMSLLEGSTLFIGSGRRWADNADAVRDVIVKFVETRYGDPV